MVHSRLRYISAIDAPSVGKFAGLAQLVRHEREILRARRKESTPIPDHDSRGDAGDEHVSVSCPAARTRRVESEGCSKAQENKADYFIPESMGGLHDGGHDMLERIACPTRIA